MTELLTRSEVLAILKCARSTVYVLMESDDFPRPIKVGHANRWLRSELEAWLDAKVLNRVSKTRVLK